MAVSILDQEQLSDSSSVTMARSSRQSSLGSGSLTPNSTSDQLLEIMSGNLSHAFAVSQRAKDHFHSHAKSFSNYCSSLESKESPDTSIELAARFLEYSLNQLGDEGANSANHWSPLLAEILESFEEDFLEKGDIHEQVESMDLPPSKRSSVLKAYYGAAKYTNSPKLSRRPSISAPFSRDDSVVAIFSGQGAVNPKCFSELAEIYNVYRPLVETLFSRVSSRLSSLSSRSDVSSFFGVKHFDIIQWLNNPDDTPDGSVLALAPYSFPILGLISLANYYVTCATLGLHPGELSQRFSSASGHSQGVVIAAVLSKVDSLDSFYDAAGFAVELLFWIGWESQQRSLRSNLSGPEIKDCEDNSEGAPSPMLSVRGLDRQTLEKFIEGKENVHLALANSPDSFVLSGTVRALHSLVLSWRKVRNEDGKDQSRTLFSKRKPDFSFSFLPISAPFHSPLLDGVTDAVIDRMDGKDFLSRPSAFPVLHTSSGDDAGDYSSELLLESLVEMISVDTVNWPAVLTSSMASYIMNFGPTGLDKIMLDNEEGRGVQLIDGGYPRKIADKIIPRHELLSGNPLNKLPSTCSWGETFKPTLTEGKNGRLQVKTKMSTFLGLPPVMVSGMTPTTVPWSFVRDVINTGYHIELAGGGCFAPFVMREAVQQISDSIIPGRGICVNLIYAAPEAMAWQIPLTRDLIQEGYPIDGLAIGAGVPSPDIAEEYIRTLGLKYISFKPGALSAIHEILEIAKKFPDFPIMLQWTGGRGGGHHSFEDFHDPILKSYAAIRKQENVILIAGSGFGDASDSIEYLTGAWATKFDRPKMPFDGVLFGSRLMVANEAHTSPEAKRLIVDAPGILGDGWQASYDGEAGGVMTVKSEMGQPIHKVATRGIKLWKELDDTIFSIQDRAERLKALQQKKNYLIDRLNADFQKTWFPQTDASTHVELEDMTYSQVLWRLVSLMYVKHQSRWIDPTYRGIVIGWVDRMYQRFGVSPDATVTEFENHKLEKPFEYLKYVVDSLPGCDEQLLSPEDVMRFMSLCKYKFQKPINFIPRFDDDFEFTFKKDSLWQSQDVQAVVDQDAERCCILQGPMAAKYSTRVDQTAGDILNGIIDGYIDHIKTNMTASNSFVDSTSLVDDKPGNSFLEVNGEMLKFSFPSAGKLPSSEDWAEVISSQLYSWPRSLFMESEILQGYRRIPNPLKTLLSPNYGRSGTIENCKDPSKTVITVSDSSSAPDSSARTLRASPSQHSQIQVELFEHRTSDSKPAIFSMILDYDPSSEHYSLSEVMKGRNSRIKDFYSQLWGGLMTAGQASDDFVLTRDLVSRLKCAVDPSLTGVHDNLHAPMDLAVVIAWPQLVQPLLNQRVDADLFKLVHLSHSTKFLSNASHLKIGDTLKARPCWQNVFIQQSGKVVEVKVAVDRANEPLMEVVSKFLFMGQFKDFHNTHKTTDNQLMRISVKNATTIAVMKDKEWLTLHDEPDRLIGETLAFQTRSEMTFKSSNVYKTLRTYGEVFRVARDDKLVKIGTIDCNEENCKGCPVMDFLHRFGSSEEATVPLDNAGLIGDPDSMIITLPKSNEAYAQASGDYNPIHVSKTFASLGNLPGTITHGMHISAAVRRFVALWTCDGKASRFRRYTTNFTGMSLPGQKLQVHIKHTAMLKGRLVLDVKAVNLDTDETVLQAEAEIDGPQTAYVFAGQGSQEKGMGMNLYQSSPAAKAVWDRADKFLFETLGWSIIDVVRDNPKSLTIQFGGPQGRKIRSNYLNMTIERKNKSGQLEDQPIIANLEPEATSYTFKDERGLLFMTQFAQPSLMLMELAIYADMKANGLITDNETRYAGHSLGEYGALGSFSGFMPVESLVLLGFYRGLTMQNAMERDEQGRTNYSMMAVNPSRASKSLTEEALRQLITLVTQVSPGLLEIVNFNIDKQQYVCAGELQNLYILGGTLDEIAKGKFAGSVFQNLEDEQNQDTAQVIQTIKGIEEKSKSLARPIILARGKATVPLTGIDVPFHSSLLLDGVEAYRKFLKKHVLEENVHPEKLVGRYIPNLTATPFKLDREYISGIVQLTGSPVLKEALEGMA